jgi:hypothetical protein
VTTPTGKVLDSVQTQLAVKHVQISVYGNRSHGFDNSICALLLDKRRARGTNSAARSQSDELPLERDWPDWNR